MIKGYRFYSVACEASTSTSFFTTEREAFGDLPIRALTLDFLPEVPLR